MARRALTLLALSLAVVGLNAGTAFACGGLVAPGHGEVLQKATTLSAWHAGLEHYVTGFRFAGSASTFGYIVPLPGEPTKIEKGGGWTLERLEREINPPLFALGAAASAGSDHVSVLQKVRIDALDITVVRGGGKSVAAWAARNGFDLTPDTPDVLGRYSDQGAVFALARFDRTEAAKKGLIEGDGTVIHFTIPMEAPWIPLRILALGKARTEAVDADLFILTDGRPSLSPSPVEMDGVTLRAFGPANPALLADLRSDRGMGWLPGHGMWLTALSMHTEARAISSDLSIDGGSPSRGGSVAYSPWAPVWQWWLGAMVLLAAGTVLVGVLGRRPRLGSGLVGPQAYTRPR